MVSLDNGLEVFYNRGVDYDNVVVKVLRSLEFCLAEGTFAAPIVGFCF